MLDGQMLLDLPADPAPSISELKITFSARQMLLDLPADPAPAAAIGNPYAALLEEARHKRRKIRKRYAVELQDGGPEAAEDDQATARGGVEHASLSRATVI